MLLGLSLFYVGAVLILNGLWMLGRIGDREIAVINLFTGGLYPHGRYECLPTRSLEMAVEVVKKIVTLLAAK